MEPECVLIKQEIMEDADGIFVNGNNDISLEMKDSVHERIKQEPVADVEPVQYDAKEWSQSLVSECVLVKVGYVKDEHMMDPLKRNLPVKDPLCILVKEEFLEDEVPNEPIENVWPQVKEESTGACDVLQVKLEPEEEITVEENNADIGEGPEGISCCDTYGDVDLCTSFIGVEPYRKAYSTVRPCPDTSVCTLDRIVPVLNSCGIKKKNYSCEKTHKCEHCGKAFTRRSHLIYHLRIHSGERPHKCKDCGKDFVTTSNLERHLRIHSSDRPHKCEHCGKGFTVPSLLNRHLIVHTVVKGHKCEECGKRFAQRRHLTKHIRVHDGVKLHNCDHCGRNFSLRCNLIYHLRLHSGEKPHKCEECGKHFVYPSKLAKHMKTHTRKITLKCTT